eukprot:c21777_g7_i1.p1 GENE.c21777_g7_i1~~c21777_g7_i1.p1  ORF type:complete len:624 (-),score=221.98 c21777_g7_i1:42-1862(-)
MATLKNIYAPAPVTARGSHTVIKTHEAKDKLIYVNHKSCVIRSISDPIKADLYGSHAGANVTAGSLSPAGNWMCTGDEKGKIKVWAPENEEKIVKLELDAIGGQVNDIDWSPDSQRIVVVGDGRQTYGKVFMWDSGSNVGQIDGHSKKLNSVSYRTARPFRIATASDDMQANFFQGPPFKFDHGMREHTNFVTCARFSPDGNFLATCGADKTVQLYNGQSGELVGAFGEPTAHAGSVYQLAWSKDSKKLVSVSADKTAKIWNAETRACEKTLSVGDPKDVSSMLVGVSWVNETIILLSLDGDLHYFKANEDAPFKTITGHQSSANSVFYDQATKTTYSGDTSGRVCAWKLGEGPVGRVKGAAASMFQSSVKGIAVVDGVLYACSSDHKVFRANPATLEIQDSVKMEKPCLGLAGVPNSSGATLVLLSNAVVLLQSLQKVSEFPLSYEGSAIAVSADGRTVAVGTEDGVVHFYHLRADSVGDLEKSVSFSQKKINSISFSPNNEYVAVADSNREVHVLTNVDKESKQFEWRYHNSSPVSLAWSSDSTKILSGGLDSHIFVWDVNQPKKQQKVAFAHQGSVLAVSFTDSDNVFVSAGEDACLKTWTLA